MFDVGFSELILIGIVALVVLGPERLPKAARFVGLWLRRARAQWSSVKDELEKELRADEMKRSMRQVEESFKQTGEQLRQQGNVLQREVDELKQAGEGLAASVKVGDEGKVADVEPVGVGLAEIESGDIKAVDNDEVGEAVVVGGAEVDGGSDVTKV